MNQAIKAGDFKTNPDMNVYDKYANLEKAIDGAKKTWVKAEANPDDVLNKNKARYNDLLGEILARLNLKKNEVKQCLETKKISEGGETPEQVADLPVDDFLKKWVNHHLKHLVILKF